MPIWEIEKNGEMFEVDAPTQEAALSALGAFGSADSKPAGEPAPKPAFGGHATSIGANDRSMVDRALDLVPNRERLSEGIPGVISGAVKHADNAVRQSGDMLRAGWNMIAPDALDVDRPYQREGDAPTTTPYEQLGKRGVQTAELTAAGKGIVNAAKAMPGVIARGLGASTARAGETLGAVRQAAGAVPIEMGDAAQVATRITELAQRGGSMPRAVRQILGRINDAEKGPMTFDEVRDFYSNISRLSTNEYHRLTPVMQREVGNLRSVLHEALTKGAETVGKGEDYASAIREYAKGSQLESTVGDMGRDAAKWGARTLGVGAAGGVMKALYDYLNK
jgi:hypothetical protein